MGKSKQDAAIGPVLDEIIRRAADEVEATLAGALADEPDGVHQHRVRVRRLRSVLGGFREVLDARAADRLRVAFAEWGRDLGVVRDTEVRATIAEEMLLRAGVRDPHVVRRLVEEERAAYPAVHARLVELAASSRAQDRMRLLRQFAEGAVAVDPDADARGVISAVLEDQIRRASKAGRALDGTGERYHDLRKAARRARYVAEAVGEAAPDLFAQQVDDIAEAGDQLHDALGGHRDEMLLAHRARHEGVLAARAGEPSQPYDVVADLAVAAADEHLARVPRAMKKLKAAASRQP